jgi:hypothetical protein
MFVEYSSDGQISAAYVEQQYPDQKWVPRSNEAFQAFLDDTPIRQRQRDRGLDFPHLVVAVARDGQVVLRSNVNPDGLLSFSEDLKNVASELTGPPEPGDTTH